MNTKKEKDRANKPFVMPQDRLTQTTGRLGTIFLAAVALLFILVGGVMLFVDGVKELYLIYVISALLIALGIGMIVKYFVTEAYRSVHDYGFSGGALVVILGGCALARSGQLTGQIAVFVGLLVLSVAVVMLQQAMQLHIMHKKVWPVVLGLALVTLLASVLLLFDIRSVTEKVSGFAYWVLLIAGVLTLLCMLISGIGVKLFLHQERDEMLRMQKEQQLAFAREEDRKRLESQMKKLETDAEHQNRTNESKEADA